MNTGASFYIMTYNQEQFVAQAVRNAFAQDYPALEIVISDDCSTDQTWKVITETVEECKKNNPLEHKIILNRNEKNMGICAHINKIVSLCSNNVIFCSAGDDISRCDRVSKVMKVFDSSPEVMLVNSDISYIDEKGNLIAGVQNRKYKKPATLENLASGKCILVGCANACLKEVYEFYGRNLPEGYSFEDTILAFRAALLGKTVQIAEKLVSYRVSEKSLTNFDRKSPRTKEKKEEIAFQSCKAVKYQWEELVFYKEKFPGRVPEFAKLVKIFQHHLDKKEQTLWLYKYSFLKAVFLKSISPFRGKNFLKYLREAVKVKFH